MSKTGLSGHTCLLATTIYTIDHIWSDNDKNNHENSTEALQRSNGKQIYLIVWMAESQITISTMFIHVAFVVCTTGANRPEMKDKVLKTNMYTAWLLFICCGYGYHLNGILVN